MRALLAMAASSEFAAEAKAFCEKAGALATAYGIEPALLRFPLEPLQVAVVVSEVQRLRAVLENYAADPALWATKSAEWSACLDDYDLVLEAAAAVVQRPVARLPFGSRRHFRPEERTEIEALLQARLAGAHA